MKRIAKLSILLGLFLLLTGVVYAGSSKSAVVNLKNATVPWEVPALVGGLDESNYECADIPAGLVITPVDFHSDRLKKANVMDRPHGGQRITLDDTVRGLAMDQYGETYNFLYKNHATFTDDGQGIVQARMTDVFWMHGGDVNYTVSCNWRWQYEAPNGIVLTKIYDGGTLVNLGVSPRPFATADGFTENPDIIPGSWRQIYTHGFIFGCDPI